MGVRACVTILRPANAWTALADVAAGASVALGAWPAPGRFAPALAASACLYASGMAFNDVFDLARDRTLHPERPLPSGALARRRAAVLAAGLMAGGVGLAWLAGPATGLAGALLAGAILLYDAGLSHRPIGPVAMGACRALNVLLGATLAGGVRWPAFAAAALVGLYTVGISLVARQEPRPARRGRVVAGWLPCLLAAGGVPILAALAGANAGAAVPFAVAVAAVTGYRVLTALRAGTTGAVAALVGTAILALPILDGALVAGFHDGWRGLAVAALAAPAWLMSRRFRMT